MSAYGFPKPVKGAYRRARNAKARESVAFEQKEKAYVRRTDRTCRWPHMCEQFDPLEVAHIHAKGMGGSPDGRRNVRTNLILLCQSTHQGRPSLHSGERRVVPLDRELGTRGPCVYQQLTEGVWLVVGADRAGRYVSSAAVGA